MRGQMKEVSQAMAFRFRGGIHPAYNKERTAGKAVEVLSAPKLLYFPVSQHIGAPCREKVKVGERVLLGQIIADSDAQVSSPIHSSVSGTVRAIEPHAHPSGARVTTIVVENDFEDEVSPEVQPCGIPVDALTMNDLLPMVRRAGIVGMGGAGFPAQIKIASAYQKIDTLLLNGAECEPYLTSDHRLMLEAPETILFGATILRKCFGMKKITICVEDNKHDAVEALRAAIGARTDIEVLELPTKYPQGSEKHIIKAATGREVPSGKLPVEAKCAVFNVDSAASIARAYKSGRPVFQRLVTVTGSGVCQPKNVLVRMGTPFSEVIDFCGGLTDNARKVIMGGPMMGAAQYDLSAPVIKTTSGLLCLTEAEDRDASPTACIRCGRCIKACPMQLEPVYLNHYSEAGDLAETERWGVMDCIECGSCAYVCPARLPLVARFRVAKLRINENRRREQAKEEKK